MWIAFVSAATSHAHSSATNRCICSYYSSRSVAQRRGHTAPHRRSSAAVITSSQKRSSAAPSVVDEHNGAQQAKKELLQLLEAPSVKDRGIFGLEDEDEEQIMAAIEKLEAEGAELAKKLHPTSEDGYAILDGRWRLVFTTLQILGKRRVKLGLAPSGKPGVVKLGELYQSVDTNAGRARNEVEFDVMGMVRGVFTIDASYETTTPTSVAVKTERSELSPPKLQELLGEHFNLLLEIFNPEGSLTITYLDSNFRVGRNAADEIFVLEKLRSSESSNST